MVLFPISRRFFGQSTTVMSSTHVKSSNKSRLIEKCNTDTSKAQQVGVQIVSMDQDTVFRF